jgi:hypothetical protein
MYRALLMAHKHMANLVLFEQLVVDEKHGPARIAEDVVNLFFLQAPDYNLRTGQDHGSTQKY